MEEKENHLRHSLNRVQDRVCAMLDISKKTLRLHVKKHEQEISVHNQGMSSSSCHDGGQNAEMAPSTPKKRMVYNI